MPYPNTSKERVLGGHAVLIVGYNKNRNVFIVRNSWGTGWGEGGYFYMPFQVIQNTNMSSDFWIIKTITNP
jgi:C1A family cysteine protease